MRKKDANTLSVGAREREREIGLVQLFFSFCLLMANGLAETAKSMVIYLE